MENNAAAYAVGSGNYHFLKYGPGAILCFVGAKMGLAHSAWKIDGIVSLGVITGILAIIGIASIIHRKTH